MMPYFNTPSFTTIYFLFIWNLISISIFLGCMLWEVSELFDFWTGVIQRYPFRSPIFILFPPSNAMTTLF